MTTLESILLILLVLTNYCWIVFFSHYRYEIRKRIQEAKKDGKL